MADRRPVLSRWLFGGVLFAFFLPFMTVSCMGEQVATVSGVALVVGGAATVDDNLAGEFDRPGPATGRRSPEEQVPAEPWAAVAALSALVGLALALTAGMASPGMLGSLAAAGATSLVLLRVSHSAELTEMRQAGFEVSYSWGWWLAAGGFTAAILVNATLKPAVRRPASASSAVDRFLAAGRDPPAVSVSPQSDADEDMESVDVAEPVSCPACRARIRSGQRFCPLCGTSCDGARTTEREAADQPLVPGSEAMRAVGAEAALSTVCSACGAAVLRAEDRFCTACGAAQTDNPQDPPRLCGSCGASLVDRTAAFCGQCGVAVTRPQKTGPTNAAEVHNPNGEARVSPSTGSSGGDGGRRAGGRVLSPALAAIVLLAIAVVAGGVRLVARTGNAGADQVPAASTYRANMARTGEQPGPGPTGPPIEFAWKLDDVCWLNPPVASGHAVYLIVGSECNGFVAASQEDGVVRWRVELTEKIRHFTVTDGTVYLTTFDPGRQAGALYALDTATGGERWRNDRPGLPAVIDGVVFAVGGGTLYALDPDDGEELWSFRPHAGLALNGHPAVENGIVYVTSSGQERQAFVYAVDATSGLQRWSKRLQASQDLILTGVMVADGIVYVGSLETDNQSAVLHALGARTGADLWQLPGVRLRQYAVAEGTVLATVAQEAAAAELYDLVAVDARTGAELWRVEDRSAGPFVVADGFVYMVSREGLRDREAATPGSANAGPLSEDRSSEAVWGILQVEGEPTVDVIIVAEDGNGVEVGRSVSDTSGRWGIALPDSGTYRVRLETSTLPDGVELSDPSRQTMEMVVEGRPRNVLFQLRGPDSQDPPWELVAVDARTGRVRWTWTRADAPPGLMLVQGGRVYVPGGGSSMHVFEAPS